MADTDLLLWMAFLKTKIKKYNIYIYIYIYIYIRYMVISLLILECFGFQKFSGFDSVFKDTVVFKNDYGFKKKLFQDFCLVSTNFSEVWKLIWVFVSLMDEKMEASRMNFQQSKDWLWYHNKNWIFNNKNKRNERTKG